MSEWRWIRSPWMVVSASGVLLAAIALLHYAAGPAFGLSLFYIAPILLVTWLARKEWGIVFGLLSAGSMLTADAAAGADAHVLVWNTGLRLSYLLVVWVMVVLAKMRRENLEHSLQDREAALNRLAEETRKQQLQIETEQLRNALLSSVSHDLRTPLAAITGAASSLLENTAPVTESYRREMIETIYEEAETMGQHVNNLLEMTRLQAGTLKVEKESQPLEEVVGSACQRLGRHLGNRPVRIIVPPDLPLVPADEVLLEKVFFNLIENAVKYTPEGSPVEIEARQEEDNVLVEVRDYGPGLGPGEEERIFGKFYRGAMHGKASGAGLGLTICRGIVRAHGGKIWAENRPGGGAVFKFTLPLEFDALAEPPEGPELTPDADDIPR